MGTLAEFRKFLTARREELYQAEQKLCQLQQKYEQYFSEVTRVREQEYQQLRDHIVRDEAKLAPELRQALSSARTDAERDFEIKLAALAREADLLESKAEVTRKESLDAEEKIHGRNVSLDRQEEALKARSAKLLQEIAQHNREIRELGRGFGFFKNFFKMRRLQRRRRELDEAQGDLGARIEKLRQRWSDSESVHHAREAKLQQTWVEQQTEAAALRAKIEHLRTARTAVVERSAIEQVLFAYRPELRAPAAGDPPCPRCGLGNPETSHFCRICAQRLKPDRPDLEGSLTEIAELNLHFESFSAGMRACQEIIGLVRGLKTGHENFAKSVDDMITTERVHPVAKLAIDVPQASVSYGENFRVLAGAVDPERAVHPCSFAAEVERVIAGTYTEDKIKDYFETMGHELSRRAEAQW